MDNDAASRLANAIVEQAAKDYIRALKQLKRNPKYAPAQQEKKSLERFFHSGWYRMLTNVDAEYIIERIQKAVMT